VTEELAGRGAKLLVVACNSATAAALPALRRRMMETTLGLTCSRRAPGGAARGGRAQRQDRPAGHADDGRQPRLRGGGRRDRRARDAARGACPTLAAIIQAGEQFDERAVQTVRDVCAAEAGGRRHGDPGCTHYPLIQPMLQRILGPGVRLISSGAALARQVEHALSTRNLQNPQQTRVPTASSARRHRGLRAGGRASCRCRWARSSTLRSRRGGGGVSAGERSYGRGPGELRRSRSSPGSCAPRPARR